MPATIRPTGLAYMAMLTASRMARKVAIPALSRASGAVMMDQAIPSPRVASLAKPAISIQVPVTMLSPTMASRA